DDFSNAVSSLEKDLQSGIPAWSNVQVSPSPDSAANSLLANYKASTSSEIDFSQRVFITDEERDNLLAESTQLINEARDFDSMTKVTKDLEENVLNIIQSRAEEFIEEVWQEKGQIMNEVNTHIEVVLEQQREAIQKEAEEHIEKTVQFYKE